MAHFYELFFPCVWLAWMVTWFVFARDVKTTVQRPPVAVLLLDRMTLVVAGLLLWVRPIPVPALMERFLPAVQWPLWAAAGALLTAGGLLFTVWARVYLGRNWSGVVALKADHELVTTGPYGLVRHPIYTGLVLAFVGTALAGGRWAGVLAVLLALIVMVQRMRVEERWMRAQFGAAYDAYARRVRAFIPGLI